METGAACRYFKRKKSKRGGPILQKGQSHFAIAQQSRRVGALKSG